MPGITQPRPSNRRTHRKIIQDLPNAVAADSWRQTPVPREIESSGAPLIATEEIAACNVCGGERLVPLAVGFDYELQTCRNPWRFVTCAACQHVWLNPRPAVSALNIIYPAHYYAYNYETNIHSLAVRAKGLLDRFKMRAILRCLPRDPKSYIDIGCGSGRFLKSMAEQGLDRSRIHGLELDSSVVEDLRQEGFQAHCQRVEQCDQIPDGSLDLATMFHVIEHVDNPAEVVRRVSRWLAPGGVFAIETPNIDCPEARLFGNRYWGGYHIPRHWHLFSPQTLATVCNQAGLEVLATKYQTGHSFWMYSCHHALRFGRNLHPRIAMRLFDPFRGFLPLLAGFTAVDKARAMLGRRTGAMLMLARKPAN